MEQGQNRWTQQISINQTWRLALISLVGTLGLGKIDFIKHVQYIAEANKTLNMIMIGSTTCLIYQGYQELGH